MITPGEPLIHARSYTAASIGYATVRAFLFVVAAITNCVSAHDPLLVLIGFWVGWLSSGIALSATVSMVTASGTTRRHRPAKDRRGTWSRGPMTFDPVGAECDRVLSLWREGPVPRSRGDTGR
jgi:hypothetical protein